MITLTDGRQSVCGASLLSETRAVTAAHCWWDGRNQARSFTVVYGSIYLFRGGTRINTNTVEMHQNYNFRNLRNDIAIITHSRVVFGSKLMSNFLTLIDFGVHHKMLQTLLHLKSLKLGAYQPSFNDVIWLLSNSKDVVISQLRIFHYSASCIKLQGTFTF